MNIDEIELLALNENRLWQMKGLNYPHMLWSAEELTKALEHKTYRSICFYLHARIGSIPIIESLISNGIDIGEKDLKGNSLGFATITNMMIHPLNVDKSLTIIKMMVDSGFDINDRGHFGETLIAKAANLNQEAFVKFLKELGCDPDQTDYNNNMNALGCLVYDNVNIAELLITDKTDFQTNGLFNKTLLDHHKRNPKVYNLLNQTIAARGLNIS